MNKQSKPRSRRDDIVVQEMDGEVLIYDLRKNKALCLNETSALVWQACNGDKTIAEISQSIGKKLNSTADDDLVWLALDQLKKENLIENEEEIAVDFNGMSRREVIRKVGLASVIALPVVSALVAPKAAQAASCIAAGGACTTTSGSAPCCAGSSCKNNPGGSGNVCR